MGEWRRRDERSIQIFLGLARCHRGGMGGSFEAHLCAEPVLFTTLQLSTLRGHSEAQPFRKY